MSTLKHGPVVPQVERILRERVQRGDWRVGERLPNEAQLATELGVGRSSVREAVRLLVRDGLLDVRHGSGTFVAEPVAGGDMATMVRRARLREVYEVRRGLEVEAARLAARRVRPEDVQKLRDALKRRQDAVGGAPAVFTDADLAFHLIVVELAGNALLTELFTSILPVLRAAIVELVTYEDALPDTADPHDELVRALEAGDAEQAVRATLAHLHTVMDLIEAELEQC